MFKAILIFLLLDVVLFTTAQDVIFKNVNQSLLWMNPSFTGSNGNIRNQALVQVAEGDIAVYNGFDLYVKPLKGAIGLTYLLQPAYRISRMTSGFAYAQHFQIDQKLKIIPSFQISLLRLKQTDYDVHQTVTPGLAQNMLDLNAGLLINYDRFYLGAGLFHLNQPEAIAEFGGYRLRSRLSIHSSYNFKHKERNIFNLMLRYDQSFVYHYYPIHYRNLHLNCTAVFFKHLILGLGFGLYQEHNVCFGFRASRFSFSLIYAQQWGPRSAQWLTYSTNWFGGSRSLDDKLELQLSINFRNKEMKKELTNFETW